MSKIEIKNITKNLGNKRILDNINLEIEEGEMISLLGPSGCGKTTTLKIIAGLMLPDYGDILFNGESILKVPVEKRGAVIVFQDYLLFPHMTVEDNIGFGLKMAKVKRDVIKKKVNEMIELVGLMGHGKKYPKELSGGQKQRVAIARALAIEPKVLLLDEPFSNLDTRLRENMRDFISDIQRELKITTVLVTHDKEEALMMSDKIAVMFDGNIKQYGSPTDIYNRPVSPQIADFFGEKNYIEGEIEDGLFISRLGKVKTTFNAFKKVKAMIKPEDIQLGLKEDKETIVGTVIDRKFAGDRVYYKVLANELELKVISDGKTLFDINEEVSIMIDFNNALFYLKENER
jgi:iron(III) transport system ATP-binding protein